MNYSSTILVQPLYNICNEIEELYNKYGDKVLEYDNLKESSDTVAPKNAIINYYTNMVDHLNKYNILKAMIKNEKKRSDREVSLFQSMVYIIIILATIIIFFLLLSSFFDALNMLGVEVTVLDLFKKLYYLILTISLPTFFIVQILNPLANSHYNKNEVIYNTDIFNSSFSIKYLTDMMNIDTSMNAKENDEVVIKNGKSSNPMMMWWLSKLKSYNVSFDYVPDTTTKNILQEIVCEEIEAVAEEEDITSRIGKKKFEKPKECVTQKPGCLSDYVEGVYFDKKITRENVLSFYSPCELNTVVKPFDVINKDEIHSTKYLKRVIQSYDNVYLTNEISKSMLYFKGFLLKEFDPDYQAPNEEEVTDIYKNVIGLLKMNYTFVYNLDLPFHIEYTSTTMNKFECAKHCIENEDYLACIYKENYKGKFCYFVTESDEIAFSFIKAKDPNDENKDYTAVFIKDLTTSVDIYSKYEPISENINRLFNNNSKLTTNLENYSYCVADLSGKCVTNSTNEIAAFSSEKDVGYESIFSSSTSDEIKDTSLYKYKTTLKSIKQANFTIGIKDTLITLKDYIIPKIILFIVEKDPSLVFRLDENKIVDVVKTFYDKDYVIVSSIFIDIINETNNKLETMSSQKQGDKFVSYEKFVSKFSALSQYSFINDYLKHIDNIRFVSKSLYNLREKYDYKTNSEKVTNNVVKTLLYISVFFGGIELIRKIVNLLTKEVDEKMQSTNPQYYEFKDGDKISHKKGSTKLMRNGQAWENDVLWRSRWWNSFTDATVFSSVLILIYLFIVAFLFAWSTKSYSVYNFNKLVSDTNGNKIKNSALALFDYYFEFINKKNSFIILDEKIKVNSLDDLKMGYIKEKSSVSTSDKVIINVGNNDMTLQYNTLKQILNDYEKCNYMTSGIPNSVPFPVVEFTMYSIILSITLLFVVYLFFVVNPYKKILEIKILLFIKEELKNNRSISKIDTVGIFGDDIGENYITVASKAIMSILIIMAAIFLFVLFYSNSASFQSSLYGSELFQDSQCYAP